MAESYSELQPSKWRDNHGNVLMGFVVLVLAIGSAILAFEQVQRNSSLSTNPPPIAEPVPTTEPSGVPGTNGENGPTIEDGANPELAVDNQLQPALTSQQDAVAAETPVPAENP